MNGRYSLVEKRAGVRFLSELYRLDAPEAVLLAEYPSSNSRETIFQNSSRYIIHDPFPPPRPELMKVLGPHHLMCCWGKHLKVTSQIAPPAILLEHWKTVFGQAGCPVWQPFDSDGSFVTLFPHESVPAHRQTVDPDINYAIHSKEVIEKIDCPQADVLESVIPPCIVKLSHGYAGLGNFTIRNAADETAMRQQLARQWPNSRLVINSIIENVTGDYGVQFYLTRRGDMIWLGLTQQHFDENDRWNGGSFSAELEDELFDDLKPIVEASGRYLSGCGYFGVVGIDVLRDSSNGFFLVDVNPRLTGITPFLMASRMFVTEGASQGVYQASCRFHGSMTQLLTRIGGVKDARIVVLGAFEDAGNSVTICHLSVSSDSRSNNQKILERLLANR